MSRPKGSLNKISGDTKTAIAAFVSGRVGRVVSLWDELAESSEAPNKARAIELWAKIAEYVTPKLGRTEVTGESGGPVVIEIVKLAEER